MQIPQLIDRVNEICGAAIKGPPKVKGIWLVWRAGTHHKKLNKYCGRIIKRTGHPAYVNDGIIGVRSY